MPPKYKCSFQDEWLASERFGSWIKKCSDKHKAYCKKCLKEFSVAGLGVKALDIHASGKAHQEKEAISMKQCKLIFPVNEEDSQTSSQSSITYSS